MIRTKIVATMGPAVASADTLLSLFQAGADVCRLNFSHGTLDQHLAMLRVIREAAARHTQPVAILGDLCGPKIRLGQIADQDNTGGMPVSVGDEIFLQRQPVVGASGRVSSTLPTLIDDIRVGDRLLIEDGLIRFVCTDKNYNELRLSCTTAGVLKSAKGINLPNTPLNVPSITDRDWQCIDWAIENDLDYLALSFVRRPDELILLREHLRHRSSDIPIIAKIEKAEAVKDIDPIIDAADGLMVARGDLGVEMDAAQVPIIQKDLIRRCQSAGKPVIVATQMLQSMIDQASPTRAEVSDVANAIFDGTDSVMLSGETSVGKFPVGAVHVMNHIAVTTEEYLASLIGPATAPPIRLKTMSVSASLAKGVWQIVNDLKPRLVVIWSQNGMTARIFSKARFPVQVIALSSDHRTLRRMALQYGITPREMPAPPDFPSLVTQIDDMLRAQQFVSPGDRVLIVAGSTMGTPGTLDGIVIHTIGHQWTEPPASAQSLDDLPAPLDFA
jgi:pyruvate kinase